jgi:hypothetical protein
VRLYDQNLAETQGILMENNLVKLLQEKLNKATENRSRQRKRVEAGQSDESHLAYSDGFVDGIECAIATIVTADVLASAKEDGNERQG